MGALTGSLVPAIALLLAGIGALGTETSTTSADRPTDLTRPPAVKKYFIVEEDSVAVAGKHFAFGRAEAKCPAGYVIMSGGAQITGGADMNIAESYPTPENSWIATGVQPLFFFGSPTPGPSEITAIAICAKSGRIIAGKTAALADTTVFTRRKYRIPGIWGVRVSVSAPCPEGTSIITGGADIDDTSFPYITKSDAEFLGRDSWDVEVQQPPLGTGVKAPDPGIVWAYALCSKSRAPLVNPGATAARRPAVTYKWDFDSVPLPRGPYRVAKHELKCAKGWRMLAGGASIGGSDYAHLAQSYPLFSLNAWAVAAVQPRFGAAPAPAGELFVTVFCAKRGSPIVPP
jgi:hypothetical protein